MWSITREVVLQGTTHPEDSWKPRWRQIARPHWESNIFKQFQVVSSCFQFPVSTKQELMATPVASFATVLPPCPHLGLHQEELLGCLRHHGTECAPRPSCQSWARRLDFGTMALERIHHTASHWKSLHRKQQCLHCWTTSMMGSLKYEWKLV